MCLCHIFIHQRIMEVYGLTGYGHLKDFSMDTLDLEKQSSMMRKTGCEFEDFLSSNRQDMLVVKEILPFNGIYMLAI